MTGTVSQKETSRHITIPTVMSTGTVGVPPRQTGVRRSILLFMGKENWIYQNYVMANQGIFYIWAYRWLIYPVTVGILAWLHKIPCWETRVRSPGWVPYQDSAPPLFSRPSFRVGNVVREARPGRASFKSAKGVGLTTTGRDVEVLR